MVFLRQRAKTELIYPPIRLNKESMGHIENRMILAKTNQLKTQINALDAKAQTGFCDRY
jgi:hypothetical protein